MTRLFSALLLVCFFAERTSSHPLEPTKTISNKKYGQQHLPGGVGMGGQPPNCFPAIGFQMPASVKDIEDDVGTRRSMSDWWCDYSTEYAFMGFSYEVTGCTLSFLFSKVVSR